MGKYKRITEVTEDAHHLGIRLDVSNLICEKAVNQRGEFEIQFCESFTLEEYERIINNANCIVDIFESHKCNDICEFLKNDLVTCDEILEVYDLISEMEYIFALLKFRIYSKNTSVKESDIIPTFFIC